MIPTIFPAPPMSPPQTLPTAKMELDTFGMPRCVLIAPCAATDFRRSCALQPDEQHAQYKIPLVLDPASSKTQVAYPTSAVLGPYTDIYFRGFDNAFPDYYRFKEWEREFDNKFAKGGLPNLSLVRLMHDHTGDFGQAILGVNTPELQVPTTTTPSDSSRKKSPTALIKTTL